MATIRDGQRPVMLVVDTQVGVMASCWDPERVLGNVARAVERARAAQVPVLWVQHADDEHLASGSAAWQWAPPLSPAEGERVVHKRHNSAFEDSTLDAELAVLGATGIVLAGAQTNWCLRATAYGALERGYDLTLVADAHTTESMALDAQTTIAAADVVRELNIAMRWLSYPGRSNRALKVHELDFGAAR